MHEFWVSLRLGMMIFMVSRVKQGFWKGFRGMEYDLESFGLNLKILLWKCEREDDEVSRGYKRINTYSQLKESTKRYEATNSPLKGTHPRDKITRYKFRHSRESTQEIRKQDIYFATQEIRE